MRRQTGQPERHRAGYSLLEALTVLLIIAILSSIAILAYGSYRRGVRSQTTAQQIEALLSTARTTAINHNAHAHAVFDLTVAGMWIDQVDSTGNVIVPKITTPEPWSSHVRLAQVEVNGQATSQGIVRVMFHPNGTSDAARFSLFVPKSDSLNRSNQLTVVLYSSTARSRTYEGAGP